MKYAIRPIVCDYAVFCIETGKIMCICNIKKNAELIADILNADTGDNFHSYSYDCYPNAKYKILRQKRVNLMQIVININDNLYTRLFENGEIDAVDMLRVCATVRKGAPLPQGHGRLIDADELKSLSYEVLVDTDNPNRADGLSAFNGVTEEDIDLAEVIIPADREDSECK